MNLHAEINETLAKLPHVHPTMVDPYTAELTFKMLVALYLDRFPVEVSPVPEQRVVHIGAISALVER